MQSVIQTLVRRNQMDQETLTDPVSKFRVCTPESLIDTDFEYSLQPSKWETIELTNNIPSFFSRSGDMTIAMTDVRTVNGSSLVTVTTQIPHSFIVGSPIIIYGIKSYTAEGTYFVVAVNSATQFVYKAKTAQQYTGSILDNFSSYLYPAKIYQGTQYNLDYIESMETDEGPNSKISVKTVFPHGFSIGTNFNLVNSVGRKRIAFDASIIDSSETITTEFDISTVTENVNGGGLTSKLVNPYDWTSLKALYFSYTNVNTSASYINYSNHGLHTGDSVMYMASVGDDVINGLVNYQVYNTVVVDSDNIYLTEITPSISNGFQYKAYNNIYFNDNPYWFSRYTPSHTGLITNISSITAFPGYTATTIESIEVTGYFVPSSTGSWTFYISSDDSAYLWFGDQALAGYNLQNCVINNGNSQGNTEVSFSITLVAGHHYPIRIQQGNLSGLCVFSMSFEGPDVVKTSNGDGFFFSNNSPIIVSDTKKLLTSQGTTNFGYHTLMKVYLVTAVDSINGTLSISMNSSNNNDSSLVANSPLAIFSRDTNKRTFGIDSFITSHSNFSRSHYTKYYVKGTPTIGSTVSLLQIASSPNGSTSNITTNIIHGVTWVVPLSVLSEYDSFFYPNHGLSTNDPLVYSVLSGSGPSGISENTTYYVEKVNNSAFRIKPIIGSSDTIDLIDTGNGTIRFSKTIPNKNANTIYSIGHDLINGTPVIYSANSNAVIPGLSEGTTYYVANSTSNSFALTTSLVTPSTLVDITGSSTGIHYIYSSSKATDGSYKIGTVLDPYTFTMDAQFKIPSVQLTINPRTSVILNLGYIYSVDHKMRTGTRVYYNENGNTAIGGLTTFNSYYAIRVDSAHFMLATSLANAQAKVNISLTSYGTGTNHIFNIYDIGGETYVNDTVLLTNGSSLITNNGSIDFTGFIKIGDNFRVEIPNAANTTLSISSIDTVNNIITLSTNHGLSDGNYIIYISETPSDGLISGYIYYVRTTGYNANQISLYNLYTDSISDTNKVTITSNTAGNIIKRFAGTIFQSTVLEVKSTKSLILSSNAPITGIGNYIVTTGLFPVTDGYTLHRAYDGGVELIPSSNPDSQIIRQTKKYFRYQPGKGIQVSKSVNFCAPIDILSLTRTGSTAYATTRKPHRITVNDIIVLTGVAQLQQGTNYWNGTYQVTSVPDINIFTFTLINVPSESVAGGYPSFTLQSWVNSKLRVGLFDDQNGMFYEYDGTNLYTVIRNSVTQIPGICSVTFNSAMVSGINTHFTTSLVTGDMIVIKGQSYKVVHISNDNAFYIQPLYRGTTASNVVITKTNEIKVPQSQWSKDVCDGTGPTGFNLNINKIQMIYIDYSWYGAGKVRFGFKSTQGDIRYIHEFVHNNHNTEAYMRSGNLPARYEVASVGVPTFSPALMHWGTAIIMDGRFDVDKAYLFTAAGSQITYAQNDSLQFSINVSNSDTLTKYEVYDPTIGATITAYRVTATVYTVVQNIKSGTLLSGSGLQEGTKMVATPIKAIGSSGYIFIDRAPSVVSNSTITAGDLTTSDIISSSIPLISIRLSPSADTGYPGPLGSREIINHMQLILKSVGVLTTHDCEIQLLLNAYPYTKTWERVTPPSLSQLMYHTKGDSVTGGTQIYSFRVSGGIPDSTGKRYSVNNETQLSDLIPLGNSILGGDDIYPNGPDLLTVCATVIDTTGITVTTPFTVTGRLTWSEAQA